MCYVLEKYLKMQRLELEEHKYYLSEKNGKDVGWNYTIMNWIDTGNAERFHDTYVKHLPEINKICEDTCGDKCGGLEKCLLSKKEIHELLGDSK